MKKASFDPKQIERPVPELFTYYLIVSILTLAGFPFTFPLLYFKYHTLKYKFDDEGISMSWGILFHREIYLTYRRIQDIHVTRNLLHRWLNLAAVAVQTASGRATAEMVIEGFPEPELLRDYLYERMRGAKDHALPAPPPAPAEASSDQALALLEEIRDQVRRLRLERGDAS